MINNNNQQKFLLMSKWGVEKELQGKYNNKSNTNTVRDCIQFYKTYYGTHYEIYLPKSGDVEIGVHYENYGKNNINNNMLANNLLNQYKSIFDKISNYGFKVAYVKPYGQRGAYWVSLKYKVSINDDNYDLYANIIIKAMVELIEELDKTGINI